MGTLSAIQQTDRQTGYPARSRAARTAPKRTAGFDPHGFLKHTFVPFDGYCFRDWRKAEAEFFRSAENICTLYGLSKPDVSGLAFPENISACHQQIADILERGNRINCRIMQDEIRSATLTTVKRFDTGYTLYYIPVNAIMRIMAKPGLKHLSDLLCCICSYLYQITKVDYYRDQCYIHSTYSTIEDWINEDDEGKGEVYRDEQLAQLEIMMQSGDLLRTILKRPFSIKSLRSLLNVYNRSAGRDSVFADLAGEVEKLAIDYPKRSVYDAIPKAYYGLDENGNIHIDQYLCFYWSANDMFNEVFFDMVNNELNESGEQVEPVSLQWFDKPQQQVQHHFDYEPRLFAIISELVDFLTDYDK